MSISFSCLFFWVSSSSSLWWDFVLASFCFWDGWAPCCPFGGVVGEALLSYFCLLGAGFLLLFVGVSGPWFPPVFGLVRGPCCPPVFGVVGLPFWPFLKGVVGGELSFSYFNPLLFLGGWRAIICFCFRGGPGPCCHSLVWVAGVPCSPSFFEWFVCLVVFALLFWLWSALLSFSFLDLVSLAMWYSPFFFCFFFLGVLFFFLVMGFRVGLLLFSTLLLRSVISGRPHSLRALVLTISLLVTNHLGASGIQIDWGETGGAGIFDLMTSNTSSPPPQCASRQASVIPYK